ncbi:alpha/beta hydrolase domain-containing protein 11 [Quillaja saponaria]|uniref:Alpha/beta hydrolase domain-containing protein 11 n=1 Tax=Quillaja saponaria TaxID=32244 RepID=A0AAD7VHS9_QUISA|nr:alpha/beta hydrolase domain-containing protein 11 [Quillaja saponaria]
MHEFFLFLFSFFSFICFSHEEQLWVLDSIPGEVNSENSHDETREVLQTLQSLPSEIPSRKWLVSHLVELGFSKSLSEWLGTNLKKAGEHETWAFDLDGAGLMFNSYWEKSYWTLLKNPPKGMEIAVVRAENSDRWDQDSIQRIKTIASRGENESMGQVSFYVLPNSGHWVHVDNPKGLLEIMAPKIASL